MTGGIVRRDLVGADLREDATGVERPAAYERGAIARSE
jgi:hypothetical protein